MLSRTADSLFWMARYLERAENMARLIGMGRRMTAIPSAVASPRNEWFSILLASGAAQGFVAKHPIAEAWCVIPYMILDRDNPSSLISCFERARANARSARGALTVEMWEAINDSWIEMRGISAERLENGALSPLLDWVKSRAALFRGATESTALRNDGFEFAHLGFFAERLDSTARMLDVKYFAAERGYCGDAADHYVWASILQAAGLERAYLAATHADYDPRRIAEFLIFDRGCPRSIAHCAESLSLHLERLGRLYGERRSCHEVAAGLVALVDEGGVDTVFDRLGLHAFLSDAIARNTALTAAIAADYHFDLTAEPAEPEEARAAAEARAAEAREQSQAQAQAMWRARRALAVQTMESALVAPPASAAG
ncbi:MAG: alpha-E domain-containing protein [Pseudomonadota bacterium]